MYNILSDFLGIPLAQADRYIVYAAIVIAVVIVTAWAFGLVKIIDKL